MLNAEGFADLASILKVLNERYKESNITQKTIEDIIEQSDKRRYQIEENKIRAFYGHSIDVKIKMEEADPLPLKLYHGTNIKAYKIIKIEGLKKKGRQYVHLSNSIKTAYIVGKRKTQEPIILEIDTNLAKKEGVIFYHSGDMYLAEFIPSNCISLTN